MNKIPNFIAYYDSYPIFVSDKYPKKYYALVNRKKVYFGDQKYEHYYDRLGYYSDLNHLDKNRKRLYKLRHNKDRHVKGSAGWFADQILWT